MDKQPPYDAIANEQTIDILYAEYIKQTLADGKDKHGNCVVEIDEIIGDYK